MTARPREKAGTDGNATAGYRGLATGAAARPARSCDPAGSVRARAGRDAAGRQRGLRDLGHLHRRQRGARPARADRRQPLRRAEGAGTSDARDGGMRSSAPASRSTPTGGSSSAPTCWGDARARPGPASPAPDGRPWGSRFPLITIGDQVRVEAELADALGIDSWAGCHRRLHGRHACPGMGRRLPGPGRGAPSSSPAVRRRPGEQIGLYATQIAAITSDPSLAGRGLPRRPAGLRPARRIWAWPGAWGR